MPRSPTAMERDGVMKLRIQGTFEDGSTTAGGLTARGTPGQEQQCITCCRVLCVPASPQELIRQHLDARGPRAARRHHQMHRPFRLLPVLENDFEAAVGDGLIDDEPGQIGDTETGHERRQDGFTVVDAQLSRRSHRRLFARRVDVMPDAPAVER